jgi:hypothetical protein
MRSTILGPLNCFGSNDGSDRGARMKRRLFAGVLFVIAIGWCVAEPLSRGAHLVAIVCGMATIAAVLTSSRGLLRFFATAIMFVVLVVAWTFRYEEYNGVDHRNRITGSWCAAARGCW